MSYLRLHDRNAAKVRISRARSTAAVAAVLERLAAEHRTGMIPYNPGPYLQRLADLRGDQT